MEGMKEVGKGESEEKEHLFKKSKITPRTPPEERGEKGRKSRYR